MDKLLKTRIAKCDIFQHEIKNYYKYILAFHTIKIIIKCLYQ